MTDLYWELDTNLQVAAAEEYLGREYCRVWLAHCESINWANQPTAQDWIVTQQHDYYPFPPGNSATPIPPNAFTYFAVRAKMKDVSGGVLCINVDLGGGRTPMSCATQTQTLSDSSVFNPPDWPTIQKTFEELSPEGQLAVRPPFFD